MSRDETVCKYCGVSYLILHEFKLLEEKVKAMEEKVKFYEGSIEREKKLQEKLQHLSQDFEQCAGASALKTERIKEISLELENKKNALQNLNEQLRCVQNEKDVSHRQSQLLRGELNSIKDQIFGNLVKWIALKGQTSLKIKAVNLTTLAEISRLNQSLGQCQGENLVLQEEVQHLRLMSDAVELKTEQLQTSLLRESELQSRCHELEKKTQDLTSLVETIDLQFQKAAAEMSHYKELFIKKSKEVEDHQSERQILKSEIETSKSRFTNALKEQEQSLLTCQQAYQHLQEEVIERKRQEDDLKQRTSHLESELETFKNLLKQREEEVATLKEERESMLVFHQSRTEQLQETLRQKVLNEKNWQEKIEGDRAKEEAHHKEEILRLKEEARMELDIEKQKHQELIAKYQNDNDELLHTKIPALISSATNSLTEIDALQKKLHEAQAKLTEKNQEKEEWQSLKRQLAHLELQLKEEQNTSRLVTEDMREEIKRKSCELETLTQEQTRLVQNLNQVQEENAVLQDTVRRECEERYELTEALTQAREQVVELKRLSGNLPLSQRSFSRSSLTSSTVSVNNHGQKSPDCGRGATFSGLSTVTKAPACSKYKSSGNAGLPAPQPPRGRASSLDDSRRRIAAVVRRQLSQL
ncbi:protein LEKR1 isoform X2 [Tiliqua scincoides]|uniref:protein LEKR1 isoform X2 n=1 Tax=Tiliqua scincoides TaxID=71010 RepID=UPI0034631B07